MFKTKFLGLALLSTLAFPLHAEIEKPKPHDAGDTATATHTNVDNAGPKFCAAVRGNGQWIFAHFASLARLTESYGTIDMIAGGSSASVTAFLYESMLLNNSVIKCKNGKACTPEEKARRVATLLKSTEEYLEVLKQSPEGKALFDLAQIAAKISLDIKENKIEELFAAGANEQATIALQKILSNKELLSLVNPDIIKLVKLGRGQEVIAEVKKFGEFKADSPSIFFRPGLFNFATAPKFFGKIADFYAGRGFTESEKKEMDSFLDKCATTDNVGRLWSQMKEDPKYKDCSGKFNDLAKNYRENYKLDGSFTPRSKEPIGMKLPALISTSVIDSPKLVSDWHNKMDEFWKNPQTDFKFDVPFDKVKFGYWGRPQDLKLIKSKFRNTTDAKSAKFLGLGPAGSKSVGWTNWEEALRTSPAEPGLANIQPIDDHRLSVGGWSDLHPTLVLKAAGCQNVVYVTREGEESDFAMGVANLLGLPKGSEQERSLYKLGAEDGLPVSSYQRSINKSEAVWCTDWNHGNPKENGKLIEMSYNATLVTEAPFFQKPLAGNPTRVSKKDGPGCGSVKDPTEKIR